MSVSVDATSALVAPRSIPTGLVPSASGTSKVIHSLMLPEPVTVMLSYLTALSKSASAYFGMRNGTLARPLRVLMLSNPLFIKRQSRPYRNNAADLLKLKAWVAGRQLERAEL